MVDVAKVLFSKDGLVHGSLAGLSESLASDKVVKSFVLVGANNVSSARLVLNALMANGALSSSLAESEVAINGGEAQEELTSGLA